MYKWAYGNRTGPPSMCFLIFYPRRRREEGGDMEMENEDHDLSLLFLSLGTFWQKMEELIFFLIFSHRDKIRHKIEMTSWNGFVLPKICQPHENLDQWAVVLFLKSY